MTKIKDIIAGNYCPDCKADCKHIVHEADECIYATWFSRLLSETVEDESEKEVFYEPEKQAVILTQSKIEVMIPLDEDENKWGD